MTAWLPGWCEKPREGGYAFRYGVKTRRLRRLLSLSFWRSSTTPFLPIPIQKNIPRLVWRICPLKYVPHFAPRVVRRDELVRAQKSKAPSLILFLILLFSWAVLSPAKGFANGVTVENVALVDQDTSADTIKIEFDLSWNNAWKDAANQDAVWVFAKFCTSNCSTNGTWSHATLKTSGTNPTGCSDGTKQSGSAFAALDLIVPSDKKGCFIQPSSNNSGTVDFHDVQLVWDYAEDGLADADADGTNTRVKVFAIEMVHIPEAGFSVGDGSDGTAAADAHFEYGRDSSLAPSVGSEAGIQLDDCISPDCWYYNSGGNSNENSDGDIFFVDEAFPKGFQAFYLMKYELSQGQYRDFLNTLTQAQQTTRVASDLTDRNDENTYVMVAEGQGTVVNRQTIKAGANPPDGDPYTFTCDLDDNDTGDEASDGEWIAMNYLSWMDLLAYADWAALRPMTELEYEKSCRGSISAVDGEYAWGSTDLTQATSISNSGQTGEVAGQTGNGLSNYDSGVAGPMRVGFSATASTTTRKAAGATYYGVLDMSGNVWERVVTVGNSTGRSYSGTHGDGNLNSSGNADNSDWPGYDGDDVTGAAGGAFKGGAWDEANTYSLEVSNRDIAAYEDATRRVDSGGRLVRTA